MALVQISIQVKAQTLCLCALATARLGASVNPASGGRSFLITPNVLSGDAFFFYYCDFR